MVPKLAHDLGGLLEAARAAVGNGDWLTARNCYEAVLERDQSGEALFGLGVALFWLSETDGSLRAWEQAFVTFRRRPDPARALMAAVYLCLAYRMTLGNDAAARGWLGRASTVVEEFSLPELGGWVLLLRAHLAIDAGHPAEAETWARQALGMARSSGDADLELCSLGELGAALVEQGAVDEGTALLDEAMAGAYAGEGGDLDSVVLISCRSITACSRIGDVKRATQWVRAADAFHRRYGSPHLFATCRTQYGGILFASGRWPEAELELAAALRVGKSAEPVVHAQALAKLAELRLAQGRLEEVAGLIAGYEHEPDAVYAAASVRLTSGDAHAALTLARRRLREVDAQSLDGAAYAELVVEAEIALGDGHGALVAAQAQAESIENMTPELARARVRRGLGRALLAIGDHASARIELESALAAFGRYAMPYEAGRSRALLAQAMAGSDREGAISEARAALETFDQLGAARDADAATALLRSLGVRASRAVGAVGRSKSLEALTRRELEVLRLLGEGLSNREIADRLFITRKTVEHHVASVLAKTGVTGRSAAAAYAARHLPEDSAAK